MGLKRTRKQRKLKGGFYTKARRGVIRNWWGDCDTLFKEHKRKRARCHLDQQRSIWEAHTEDPSKIYDNFIPQSKIVEKLYKSNVPIDMQKEILNLLNIYIPNKSTDKTTENAGLSEVGFDNLTKKQKKLYNEEEARRLYELWHQEF